MSENTYTFAPLGDASGLTCEIPVTGLNAAVAMAELDGVPIILRGDIGNNRQFERFACDVRRADPETPDRVLEPDFAVTLGVHSGAEVEMQDGVKIDFWGFQELDPLDPEGDDDDDDKRFPSPMLRLKEGDVAHVTLIPSSNTHTIHHHGIEPTPHNDGVGHTSFEVGDRYTYQWRASSAGSYFYHCHKNTVLHFELGMYGPLIVDPPQGEGFVRVDDQVESYDQEILWIPDDVDPRWHDLSHQTGLRCPFDDTQHMLRFEPEYFVLSGVASHKTRTDRRVAVDCQVGERLLIRLLNAAYGPTRLTLPFPATVIGMDGHALGGPKDGRYSQPYEIRAGDQIELGTAMRMDVLMQPDHEGAFTVPFDLRHWVRDTREGLVETTITVRA